MKELSIEQKAQAYDEAVNEIRNLRDMLLKEGVINKEGIICDNFNRIFPELKDDDDEKIRKALVEMVHDTTGDSLWIDYNVHKEDALAWLEKQGEHAKFRDSIQVGDKVTRNKDGVLVNLSQLNRVAKKDEKQGEQKPAVWSKDDEGIYQSIIDDTIQEIPLDDKQINWLKSLKDRYIWKPSEEMLEALYRAVPENVMEISEDEMLLDKLYQGLKYGKVLSKK